MPGLLNLRPYYAATKAAGATKASKTPPHGSRRHVVVKATTDAAVPEHQSSVKPAATAAQEHGPVNAPDASSKAVAEFTSDRYLTCVWPE